MQRLSDNIIGAELSYCLMPANDAGAFSSFRAKREFSDFSSTCTGDYLVDLPRDSC